MRGRERGAAESGAAGLGDRLQVSWRASLRWHLSEDVQVARG